MNEVLKIYSYNEFVNEFGKISTVDIDNNILTTSNNIKIHLPEHYIWCLHRNLFKIEDISFLYDFFVCILEERYTSDGDSYKTKVWYLFNHSFIPNLHEGDCFFVFKDSGYKIFKRYNLCKILIEYKDNDALKFLEISPKDDIFFDYKKRGLYNIVTSKGTFSAKCESRRFVYSFVKIMSIKDKGLDRYYILYMDGRFERNYTSPSVLNF